MDVGAWLRDLGLERYESAFRDNEIDAEILPKLTADDLKDMGVTVVGHRRKLLEAIAALPAPREAAMPPPDDVRAIPAPGPPAAPPNQAERRQLTVMFVDLVGSTALAGRLDPEDMGAVLRAYQDACAGEITRFEGHIAKFMGDGVLAYFGYPRAHEDEAERAVRAGLGITEAVGRLAAPGGTPLAARVGIATGLVVVGELIGEGTAQEQAVIGETPNLAARLQALAAPGSVVIGPSTRRLVDGLFDLAELGVHDLKGFAAPVSAWRVLRPGAAESRFEALRAPSLTPLVGREPELSLLLERWQRAKAGEGQVVLLSGEPGIGKSRLVRALRDRLADGEPHTPLNHFCSPFHRNTALYPVLGLLERAAGLSRTDPPECRLAKLEAVLALAVEDVQAVAPLLADLLAIPTGGRYPPLDLTPARRKERTLQGLVDQLAGLAAQRPVLALYEDAHWIDPTSKELLGRVVDRAQGLPVLAIITFRPEFTPPWTGHGHVTALSLSRLSRRQGGAMIQRVAGGKPLPEEVVEQIAAKADGVPLFAEELTKVVLESGLLKEEGGRYALAGPLPVVAAIPATLHDSLMARLDRLAPAAREVAQVGAVIGREFPHELLAAVAPLNGEALTDALNRLVEAELIFRRGGPPAVVYAFKHALVRDAAYGSLLRGRRRRLHACIAEALEERFPETAEAEPELLAHHCTEAGLAEKAVGYWHRAGQRAIARSALAEAVAQLTKGLEALAGLPDAPERERRELDLQLALGRALIAAKGPTAPETVRTLARARDLCRGEGEVRRLFPVLLGQGWFHIERGEPHAAHRVAERMLALARREGRGDATLLIPAHRALGAALLHLGRFSAAREHLEQLLTLYDAGRHRSLAAQYSFDSRTVALGCLGSALFALGYADQARRGTEEALAEARSLAHPMSLAHALFWACLFRWAARDVEGLREAAEALVALAAERGLSFYSAHGRLFRGRVLVESGRREEGLAEIQEGVAGADATGKRLRLMPLGGLVAEAHAMAGRHREALSWSAAALARTGSSRSLWFEAEKHRYHGELLLSAPESDRIEAEACFRRAIEIARAQDARMWELRAAVGLARLWRDQDRHDEARDLLAPIYGWFTEGFDIPDLREARALLDELASAPHGLRARPRRRPAAPVNNPGEPLH